MRNKKEKPVQTGLLSEIKHLAFFIRKIAGMHLSFVTISLLVAALEAAFPFVAILAPKYIIDELMGQRRMSVLVQYVAIAAVVSLVLLAVTKKLARWFRVAIADVLMEFEADIGRHSMGISYENLEDTRFIDMKERAMMPIREMRLFYWVVYSGAKSFRYFLMILGTLGIIFTFDVFCILLIILTACITSFLNSRYQKKDIAIQRELTKNQKDYGYYLDTMYDFSIGKDVRIFKMADLLMDRNRDCHDQILGFKDRSGRLQNRFNGISKILSGFRNAVVYGYIAVKTVINSVGIGSFTMYIAAATAFSDAINNFFNELIYLRQASRYLADYVALNEVPMENHTGGEMPPEEDEIKLEFRNVYFKYPGTDNYVLEGMSFIINKGESCSFVGKNGAGKTTIIKLLARLFKPTEGQILINGVDINALNYEAYSKLLSVVFQDFKLFEFSIADNMTAGRPADEKRLEEALESAGILEKVQSLPKGIDTFIGKQFDEEGTEFSGGELQKLAIARASYKDSPIIALDEPTAALDPLAEAEVYERFNDLVHGKIAIYISHRLSSCKFCKKIIFIEDGKIVEEGSHDTLVARGGLYAQMFNLQASKYLNQK